MNEEDTIEEISEDQSVHPITELQKQVDEYKAGWQRATADYQNLIKETEARRSELMQWSEQMILEEFIPVYGNFKKAFASKYDVWNQDQENWVKGIEYIMKQFETVLKQHGVEEIRAEGQMFDPTKHEAVGEEHDDNTEENAVVKIIDPGFAMKGKVIKVAKVIICKKN